MNIISKKYDELVKLKKQVKDDEKKLNELKALENKLYFKAATARRNLEMERTNDIRLTIKQVQAQHQDLMNDLSIQHQKILDECYNQELPETIKYNESKSKVDNLIKEQDEKKNTLKNLEDSEILLNEMETENKVPEQLVQYLLPFQIETINQVYSISNTELPKKEKRIHHYNMYSNEGYFDTSKRFSYKKYIDSIPHVTVIANSTGSGKTTCALVSGYLQAKLKNKMTFIIIPHNLLNQYDKDLTKLISFFPEIKDTVRVIKTIRDVPDKINELAKVFIMSTNHYKTHGLRIKKENDEEPSAIEPTYLIFDEVTSFENVFIQKIFFDFRPEEEFSHLEEEIKCRVYYPKNKNVQVLVLDTTWEELKHLSKFTRQNMIVKCSDQFIAEGYTKCKIIPYKHKCKGITDEILLDYLDKETIQLLKEGDMINAIKSIGSVKESSSFEKSIQDKFDKSIEKHTKALDELQILLSSREKRYERIYMKNEIVLDQEKEEKEDETEDNKKLTPKQKLEALVEKTRKEIINLDNIIKNEVSTRDTVINRIKELDCGICLTSEAETTAITKCCNQTYCLDCYLSWFATNKKCPMCEKRFKQDEKSFTVLAKEVKSTLPSKFDQFVNICKKEADKTFVLFSNNDASFDIDKLTEAGIKARIFMGTPATLNKILRELENHEFQVLCINSQRGASGLNIPFVDGIIYYHPPKDTFTEIQTIGRLNRMGRKKDIHAHYLMWNNEKLMSE